MKFIDLFAGIGGFHLALKSLNCECVFASEVDPFARETYEYNFKKSSPALFNSENFHTDIRTIDSFSLPDFDILCAGFPCQPFSQSGYKRGFQDTHDSERGNLFFKIVEILDVKKPKAFFLENVRGLLHHDNKKTFSIIRNTIEQELGYSFHYKIVKASDYGLPQLRPRVFMIGFKDESVLSSFSFPPNSSLKYNMSDVWEGECSREIGFTIRVGGRGSNINDRRNWDAYLVDNNIKKLMPKQAKKMQGFPEDFFFPVTNAQAMKQLGNSVAVDAIKECAKSMIDHMKNLDNHKNFILKKKNKGEWSEFYSFLKLLNDRKLFLSDKKLNIKNKNDYFSVTKVSPSNISESFYLDTQDFVIVFNKSTQSKKRIKVSRFLNNPLLKELAEKIKKGKGSFTMPPFEIIQNKLGISIWKGGKSNQKSDLILGIENHEIKKENEGFGIKSYLGNAPTLLNSSGNTNFVYKVFGLKRKNIDEVNSINNKKKVSDRIKTIYNLGGTLTFDRLETDTMKYNLSMIDHCMPELIATMLQEFHENRYSAINENLKQVFKRGKTFNTDLMSLTVKIKRLLVSILLGVFSGKKWDGRYSSNGMIVVKNNGEQVGFHIMHKNALEEYLFENIKFDTPSTTRHRYGDLIVESDGKIYFKLNLQLRFQSNC